MKRLSNNWVLLSKDDLCVLSAAVELAIELVESDIDSNTRPNPLDHDKQYRLWLRSIKESLRTYRSYSRKLAMVRK
jgi:hypothetical protein